MTLISIALVLFFIMDPIGNIASFQTVLQGTEPKRQRIIILREMAIAFAFMVFFYLIGETLLGLLQLSEVTLRVTIGLILFITGIGILFPGPRSLRLSLHAESNPVMVPMAIPLTAGPALLATIMLYARLDPSLTTVPLAIVFSWLAATAVHFWGAELQRICGKNALMGAERLCGMVLVMLAIQRFAEGIQIFISVYPRAG